jgi:pyridoxamine 5'-phosphate oxidase
MRYGAVNAAILAGMESDPYALLERWYDEAVAAGAPQPEAMGLATATSNGRPSLRTVLYKGVRDGRICFYTNYDSRKGRELAANPHAALSLYWEALRRQVRIEGTAAPLTPGESDAYWRTRPRESQLAAWASRQSAVLGNRAELLAEFAYAGMRFAGRPVPRPQNWGGFGVLPERFEFWINAEHRLHDRLLYERDGDRWQAVRLAP